MKFHNRPLKDHVYWDDDIQSDPQITVIGIEPFDARGMRMVYGRGDFIGSRPGLHLDMWKSRGGRLCARFWSRGREVDWQSHEVVGHSHTDFPKHDQRWVPQALRECYGRWVVESL